MSDRVRLIFLVVRVFSPATLPSRLWRALACVVAGLVMLLSLSAVSPDLHSWIHAEEKVHGVKECPVHGVHASSGGASEAPASEDSDQHECAVTMFSHGVVLHALAAVIQPCEGLLRAIHLRAFERLALAQPRFLHLPPQAPPAV
jgi:hypothetical protein